MHENDAKEAGRKRTVSRIIDANVNRAAEGLRVIEEIARFEKGDERLVRELKEMRHAIRRLPALFDVRPEECRDSDRDVGGRFSTGSEGTRTGFEGIARANFHRAEEGLRAIEEFGKLLRPDSSARVKDLRFRLYTLETALLGAMGGRSGMPAAPFLYTFVDRSLVAAADVGRVAQELVTGGSGMIQYRAKGLGRASMLADLGAVIAAAAPVGIPVIVNDDPSLAAESGADGVHLGPGDPPVAGARELLGPSRIIGVSIRSLDALAAVPAGLVDYLAVGSVFPTGTKADAVVTGIGLIEEVRSRTRLPVVAIGGITAGNAARVLEAGADGLAVISAVLRGDIAKNCFTLMKIVATSR